MSEAVDDFRDWLPRRADLPGVLLIAAVFWGLGHAGFSLSSLVRPDAVSVSLAAGFAIAAYLIWGYRFWVGVFLGSMAIALESGASLSTALGAGVASAFGNLVGAYLMREWAGFQNSLERVRDVFALLLFGVLVARLVATGIGTANLWLAGTLRGDQLLIIYLNRVIGGAVGVLVVTPFLLAFSEPVKRPRRAAYYLEAAAIMLVTAVVGGLVFSPAFLSPHRYPLAFLLLPLIVWAALRYEGRGATAVTLLLAGASVLGTTGGHGPFGLLPTGESTLLLALFIGVVAITGLLVAASSAERKQIATLREGMELLRQVLHLLPVGVWITDREGRVTSANPAAERIWRAGAANAYQGWGARKTRTIEMHDWLLSRATGAAETTAEEKIEVPAADGSRKMLLSSAMPLLDSGGRRIGAIAVHQDVTKMILAEQSLRELAAVVEQTDDIVYVTDRNGFIEYANPGFEKHTGYTREEAVGRTPSMLRSGKHDRSFYANLWTTILAGKPFQDVLVNRKKSGELYYESKTISSIRNTEGEITHFVSTGKDITERTQAQERIKRLARARGVMAECNRTLIHVDDEMQMFRDMCRIMVETGGYSMAWVGMVRHDAQSTIEPVASAGDRDRYLEAVRISWADNEFGSGPAGIAVRTGVPQATKDIAVDPLFAKWRKEAVARGHRAAATLPLINERETLGVIGLFAAEPEAFDAREIGLLQEVADEIAFGIRSLRLRAERNLAEDALRRAKEKLDATLRTLPDLLFELDEDGRYHEVWAHDPALLAAERARLLGNTVSAMLPAEAAEVVLDALRIAGETGAARGQIIRLLLPHGESWFELSTARKESKPGEPVHFIMLSREITARKQAEEALRTNEERLRQLSRGLFAAEEDQRRLLARELHDRVGQNVTALALNLNMLRGELPAESIEKVSARLGDCEKLLDHTAELIRDVMADLRPPGLDELGLAAALNEHAREVSGRSGFSATVRGSAVTPRLPPAVEITLFRIAQEALTNVAKHAHATEVTVALESGPDTVILTITDNGRGFDPAARPERPSASLGLVGMRERAEAIGARLRVESAPGQGARVIVEAPRAAPGVQSR